MPLQLCAWAAAPASLQEWHCRAERSRTPKRRCSQPLGSRRSAEQAVLKSSSISAPFHHAWVWCTRWEPHGEVPSTQGIFKARWIPQHSTAQHSTRMALLAFHGTCKFLHLFPMKGVLVLGSGPFYSYQDKPPGSPGSSSSPNSQRTPGSSSAPFPSDPSLPVLPCSPLSLCPPISPSLEPNSYGEKLGDPWVFSLEKGRLGGPHCHALMQPLLEHWVRVWTTQDAKDIKALGSI